MDDLHDLTWSETELSAQKYLPKSREVKMTPIALMKTLIFNFPFLN